MISEKERAVLIGVQNLPMTPKPFAAVGEQLGMTEEEVLRVCNTFLARGIIRRFAPSLAHRRIGYIANPMTALKVPENTLDEIGQLIAREPGVTHCYARSGWDYNLFFMLHAKTRGEAIRRVEQIITKTGVNDYQVHFSKEELKKVPFIIEEGEK